MGNLTNAQKSIWVTEQYYMGSSINNICGTATIQEKVDFEKLEEAIRIVCQKHDNFWLKVKVENGEVKQILSEREQIQVDIINIADKNDLEKEREKIVRTAFQLENSRLFNFYIFRFADGKGAFMLNIHHLISDAWTLALICNEIIKTYSALKQNQEIETKAIYSYIDYIKSEQEYQKSEKFNKDKQYWLERFKTIPEVATIPGSVKENIDTLNQRAKRKQYEISENEVKKIKQYCKENKISLYNFFMAIYAIYIGEISNLDEFVIGTPILNRTNFKEKNAAGMFINMAPFKINIDEKKEFKTFVKEIAKDSIDMLKHQKYSYQCLLEELRKRDNNVPNLYNILLSYQITNAHQSADDVEYETEWTFNGCCADNIDIQIYDLNDTGSLNISYDYKTSIYHTKDIEKIHERILNIIKHVIKKEEINISEIQVITETEQKKLLEDFNNTGLEYDKNIPIIKYFEEQAKKTPNTPAIIFENKKMNYKELNEKANSLAYELRRNGVTNNTIVGILQERSFEMLIAIVAVLKSGGSYIPIAPDYPNERIEYMLKDSSASILLTNETHRINTNKKIIDISLKNSRIYNEYKENLKNISKPEDLSYLIYTSGSTGTPKGVMLKQQNLSNFYNSMKCKIEYLNDSKRHKILSITTVSFDIFAFETLMSLTRGLTVYLTNENEQKITSKIEKIIKRNKIEIMQTTPSVMKFHLENLNNKESLKSLKYIILAGEPLPKTLVDKIKAIIPGIQVFNGYGPSETTIFSTFANVTEQKEITIGKPINNTQIYILNKNKKLMPQGTIGELYISGDGIGKGYINKEKQTQENFIQNPFNTEKIMYKVGDLGTYNENGEIMCYGRIDNQVKIRGLRIELTEIEKQIQEIYNIHDCVVEKKQVNGKDALCAYYVENGPVDKNSLRIILHTKLPEYMVPQYFVKLEKIPHTPNGKIDRKALPMPDIKEAEVVMVKPRNETDKKLVRIIERLLPISKVSIEDTLLELGGDSLTAITLSTKIISKFNVQINIKDILSNYTIKDMSDYIQENQSKYRKRVKIERIKEQPTYPLSSAQKRIYYNAKMIGSDNVVYNMPGGIIVDEILDIEKIKKVFNKIIERHEILRTKFVVENDEIVQKVCKNIDFEIPVYYNTTEEINEIIKKFSKPFKLEGELLIRAEVHFIDDKCTMLLVDSHHIIMDGMSLNNLIIEFNRLYNGDELKRLPIQYRDYSVWENEYNKSEDLKLNEDYWVNKFKDCEFTQLNLPYDYKLSANRSYKGNRIANVIDEKQFRKIERYAKKIGASPYMFFITAFLVLLYKYTGQEEITLGSPIANRDRNETKRMMGMLVNNIVVKGNINENETFKVFLDEVKEQVLNDLSYQPYPFDMLIKKIGIKTDNSRNPLFDVMFTYQNKEENTVQLNGKDVEILEIYNNIAKFNLSLEIKPKTHTINIEYCTDLFRRETIINFFEHYMYILEQILNNCEIKIKDIDIITEKENKILAKFNKTDGKINNDTTAYLIEKQVKKYPNNIAVICEDKTITYGELDKKANCLANHLIKNGIKNNDIVCIMTNRSIETIVAMYAVLKAGGAFLNIDPKYPLDRTKYYIESSKAQYVLTQRELKDRVKEIPNCIEIDLDNEIYNGNSSKPNVDIKMNDLSYIIYTSGSTGVPKGVMLNQVGLANMAKAMTKALDYLHDGKIHTLLSVTSTPFDIFVYEIIVSLTHGQRIVMSNNAEHRNPKLLEKLMEKYNTDVMTVTPSLMKIVYDNRSENSPLKLVKNMVFGGEPLPEKFVKDLKALDDDITVFNIYGPSEITVLSNVQNLNGETEITTGPPIMNTQIHILDKNKKRVPIGVVGEIYISGIQVGEGYLGKPELTKEKFLPNQFGEGRMYKSGDIGRWTFDGKIQCLGRIDNQIKLRGLRIELGEIENKMEQYPGVSAAIVNKITIEDKETLCGYYVTDGTIEVTETEIKSYLKKYLPQYMVPSYIVYLEKMPYTINRKIDRKALPMPKLEEDKFKEVNPDKFDTDELKLLQIWKNVLHLKNISLDDNFFDIGGDSISAIKMQIEALKYNFNFEYADIFKYPTIKELAGKKEKIKNQDDIDKYDYSEINKILDRNNEKNISTIKKFRVGNILLIGSTGYLGVHILDEYLKTHRGTIYCLVRKKNNEEPLARLKQKIIFYFGNEYYEKYKKRIQVIEGDIVYKELKLSQEDYSLLKSTITTVINAGALVKHFGTPELFNQINVDGTRNVVDFCKETNKRLIHISTISVSGNGEKEESIEETSENINDKKVFKENTLYIKQNISGIYTITKYKAEMIVLSAIKDGLNAQILRMGNITNRYSDGVFQQNVEENAFAKRLKSFIELGMFPDYLLEHAIELGPVDLCAEAVIKILDYNSICNVFHIYNPKLLPVKILINTLHELGIQIDGVDNETMSNKLTEILNDDFKKEILSGIIHDIDSKKQLIYTSNVRVKYEFSEKYLEKIGFTWKEIDREYILKYMDYFKRIGFINY